MSISRAAVRSTGIIKKPSFSKKSPLTKKSEKRAALDVVKFEEGQKVVYPGHGVGQIVAIETKEISGVHVSFYMIRILENDITVMVPLNKVSNVGVRAIVGTREVEQVYGMLKEKKVVVEQSTWNRRYREYMEKIKTGSIFEIAEVLRDLCVIRIDKVLSFGERKMLELAKGLLVKELAIAENTDEPTVEAQIEEIFQFNELTPFFCRHRGGRGSQRFKESLGQDASKVLSLWQSQPLFLHSLEVFLKHNFQEIVLVVREDDRSTIENSLSKDSRIRTVLGGSRRQDSVRNGLEALSPCDRVAIHDAARPHLTDELMRRLMQSSLEFEAVIPVVSIAETVKEVSDGLVTATRDRKSLYRVQTPQIFSYERLLALHRKHSSGMKEFTDDAMLFENEGIPVRCVSGDSKNIKVTHAEDLQFLEAFV